MSLLNSGWTGLADPNSKLTEGRVDNLKSELDADPAVNSISQVNSHKHHQERDEALARPLDDLEKGSEDGQAGCSHQHICLECVEDPKLSRRFVEAVLFFENKGVII